MSRSRSIRTVPKYRDVYQEKNTNPSSATLLIDVHANPFFRFVIFVAVVFCGVSRRMKNNGTGWDGRKWRAAFVNLRVGIWHDKIANEAAKN